ncbi:hypothetical protein HY407_03145 [Candidatus Gottesmanbacteria bacterium]|nr:hypothetical protein [Candidatus Gottesmanbacteria bacterium]
MPFSAFSFQRSAFSLLVTLFLIFAFPISFALAQSPTESITGSPTCDLCGWCAGGEKPGSWEACQACIYTEDGSIEPGAYWTVAGCLSTKPEMFVKSVLNVVFAVSGGLAFLAFIGGSALVLTSSGNPEKLNNGKSIVISSILGLLLIIFSVFILRFVGVDILRIPGFG